MTVKEVIGSLLNTKYVQRDLLTFIKRGKTLIDVSNAAEIQELYATEHVISFTYRKNWGIEKLIIELDD